jgi:NADH-quinone oxidoreductase subunit C
MTPEEIGARFAALLADGSDVVTTLSGGAQWARATVDVPARLWRDAVVAGRDDPELALDFFDWLSAVDEETEGFTVVAHLWSTSGRHGVLLRTRISDRAAPVLESIVEVYPGAGWHERETHEMFGIDFAGHPGMAPLLLPVEFEGHPLRKEFVLATRVAKPWPGAKEPGESGAGPAKRQPMRPPGVPDPNEWGPMKGQLPAAPARPARTPRAGAPAARPAREVPPPEPAEAPAAPTEAAAAATEAAAGAPEVAPAPTDAAGPPAAGTAEGE